MARVKLNLRTRDEFAALSLHEKNRYLQDVARQITEAQSEEFIPLGKDALSRLRRFYMRRSFADLKQEEIADDGLRRALGGFAEAIRTGEVQKVLEHELPAKLEHPRKIVRDAPEDDAQLMFWVPAVFDAPIKDDMNLMDIAPFALSKTTGEGIIRYELKDAIITIEGGADVGLATAYDYDIVINMISHLAEAVRQFRIQDKKGLRPSLPSRVYRPAASEILKFCRRELGGKQYLDLERALDRLQATRIKITNLTGGKRRETHRETQSFPLIGRYKVVSRTSQDRIDQIEIEIPEWVYEGIVKPDGKPSILTLNADYFLINRPIAKFLYRLARKAAGDTEAFYSLPEVHRRSGSKLPPHKFRQAVQEIVADAKLDPLPDYDLILEPGTRAPVLRMRHRKRALPPSEPSGTPAS
jgi:plasmid replication initiation protein